jgi:hypothetical protein
MVEFKGVAMKSKIISSVLISSILIQITLTSGGCMTFHPVGDNNLANHRKDANTLLIKLNDKEIKLEPSDLIYYGNDSLFIYGKGDIINLADTPSWKERSFSGIISAAKIDSEQIITYESTKYHFFWMNDKKRIIIKDKDLIILNSDLQDYYWVADLGSNGYRQIYDKDIQNIEEKGLTPTGIILGIGLLAVAIVCIVFISRIDFPSGPIGPIYQ